MPRFATSAAALAAGAAREGAQAMAVQSASGIPLELIGLLTPLPADGGRGSVPGEIVEHDAHAVGHAAVHLADRGVLLAGNMLSDVLIRLLDPRRPDQVDAFERALDRLGEAVKHVDVVVPGHGAVARGPEVAARLAADRSYIDALRRGAEPEDARPDQDWLAGPHPSNLEQARRASDLGSAASARVIAILLAGRSIRKMAQVFEGESAAFCAILSGAEPWTHGSCIRSWLPAATG